MKKERLMELAGIQLNEIAGHFAISLGEAKTLIHFLKQIEKESELPASLGNFVQRLEYWYLKQ